MLDDAIERLLDDMVAEELLRLADLTAPDLVRVGLHAVHDDEDTLTAAAVRLGRHRSNVRAIDRWVVEAGVAV